MALTRTRIPLLPLRYAWSKIALVQSALTKPLRSSEIATVDEHSPSKIS